RRPSSSRPPTPAATNSTGHSWKYWSSGCRWPTSASRASERPRPLGLLLQSFQQFLQLARLVHLFHDVRATDEFAVDIELRDRRPVGVFLDALADVGILEHVDAEEIRHAAGVESLHRERGETALRELR